MISLTEELLEKHPVWMWNDSMDDLVPVEDFIPLPNDEGDLFIRAMFEMPSGKRALGSLTGCGSCYAFSIIIEGKEFIFNINLPSRNLEKEKTIADELNDPSFSLFPLKYESEFYFEGEGKISGTFGLNWVGR